MALVAAVAGAASAAAAATVFMSADHLTEGQDHGTDNNGNDNKISRIHEKTPFLIPR